MFCKAKHTKHGKNITQPHIHFTAHMQEELCFIGAVMSTAFSNMVYTEVYTLCFDNQIKNEKKKN